MPERKRRKLLFDTILYAVSTGLNRGVLLLVFPILLSFLSVDDYGIFVLTFTVSQMLIPFITISGTTAIIREGALNHSNGSYLLEKFIVISVILFTIVMTVSLLSYPFIEKWFYFC